jgi:VanZ family protein
VKVKLFISLLWSVSLGFILYNATQTGSESSGFSLEVASILSNVLSRIGIRVDIEIFHSLIRMGGHVFQYFIFGYMTLWVILIYHLKWYNIFRTMYVMILDETIQLFTPGRAGELFDIFLDSIGVFLAVLFFLFTKQIFKKYGG